MLTTLLLIIGSIKQASAQLTGLQAIYFDNQYLVNPAMAGLDKGLNFNLGYQAQWTTLPGGPKLQDFTADYNSGSKVGVGFALNSDQSGLISRTRAMGTYAYHLPVSESSKLSFGLSFGINDTYIDYNKINGDPGDVSVQLFNNRRVYLDCDLGIAYTTTDGLNVQAAIPNLGSVIFNTEGTNLDVDRATFFTAASYKFNLSGTGNFMLEPKVVFRGIKGFSNIADAGANLSMPGYNLNVSAIYHTNQSISAGVGFNINPIRLMFSYTNNTGPLGSIVNNTFEFGVRYHIVQFN